MRYEREIRTFLEKHPIEDNMKKSAFIILAESFCGLIEGNVRGLEWECDFNDVVADVYSFVFPIVENLIDNNNRLMSEYQKQVLYGTRITLTTEEMGQLLKSLKVRLS